MPPFRSADLVSLPATLRLSSAHANPMNYGESFGHHWFRLVLVYLHTDGDAGARRLSSPVRAVRAAVRLPDWTCHPQLPPPTPMPTEG